MTPLQSAATEALDKLLQRAPPEFVEVTVDAADTTRTDVKPKEDEPA